MGSKLTPLIKPERIGLEGLEGRVLAVDALNAIYQFLALVRDARGEPLRNSRGQVTSHLVGLATRFSRLAFEHNCKFIFVFDGPPHPLKRASTRRPSPRPWYRRPWTSGSSEAAGSCSSSWASPSSTLPT
ncbi:MAG: hypothetical protein QXT79_02800, partial [Thermofilaceae archaeon]